MTKRRSENSKGYVNNNFKPFQAKNKKQRDYFSALDNFRYVFGLGAAGTGKTACAIAYAVQELYFGRISKIVITRPAVEATGESLGFLPGELNEKFLPYITPIKEIAEELIGRSAFDMWLKNNHIEAVPLAYMRGRTFKDACVIADEMQNATKEQFKMLLTRSGENCKMFINGDTSQTDISGVNGLDDAVKRLTYLPYVQVVQFGIDDIVRSDFIGEIIQAYERK